MGIRETKRQLQIQQWAKIFQERSDSGLTIREFCKTRGITRDQYLYWLRKVRTAAIEGTQNLVPAVAEAKFAEITLPVQETGRPVSGTMPCITMEVNGIVIGISSGTTKNLLKMVLEVARDA